MARKRLVRPRGDRKIAGVCAGFAEYFDLDVTWCDWSGCIVLVVGGVGLVPYLIAWIVMPEEPWRCPFRRGAGDQPVGLSGGDCRSAAEFLAIFVFVASSVSSFPLGSCPA